MKFEELKATEIYARFAEEVYDDFGDSPQEQEYYRKEHADAAIAELKAENRKLKRELWLARASEASSFAGLFSTLSYIEDDESRTYWIFGNKRKIVFDKLKCSRMETAYKWFCIWDDVANKCLKKAEEYK